MKKLLKTLNSVSNNLTHKVQRAPAVSTYVSNYKINFEINFLDTRNVTVDMYAPQGSLSVSLQCLKYTQYGPIKTSRIKNQHSNFEKK